MLRLCTVTLFLAALCTGGLRAQSPGGDFPVVEGFLTAGDTAGALRALDGVLEGDSENWEAWLLRGRLRLGTGRYDGAREDFRRALLSSDEETRSRVHEAAADLIRAATSRRLTEALKEYQLAIQLDPVNMEALFKLSELGFELGDARGYRTASSALTKLVMIDPDYREAFDLWFNKILDHTEEELRLVADSLEAKAMRDSTRRSYLLYVAYNRFNLGEIGNALAALDRLEKDLPGFEAAGRELLRARCRLALDDTLGFEDHYELALEAASVDGDYDVLAADAEPIFTPEEAAAWQGVETSEQAEEFFRAFWKRRDPDPLTQFNERRVTHYCRMNFARENFALLHPHSRFQNSRSYNRLLSIMRPQAGVGSRPIDNYGGLYEFDPDMFFQRSRTLALDQRGLLFLRHGMPSRISRPDAPMNISVQSLNDEHLRFRLQSMGIMDPGSEWYRPGEGIPDKEVWHYGSVFFAFEKVFGGGEYIFSPISARGSGSIQKAMRTESWADPVPEFHQDYTGVTFRAPGRRVELMFFQSVPADSLPTPNAPFADLAVYDSTWNQIALNTAMSMPVVRGADTSWLVANSAVLDPGEYNFALRLDVPGRRAVQRSGIALQPFLSHALDLSGVVLGSPPMAGSPGVFSRGGVDIDPRPGLSFRSGESITVFLEVYGLRPDSLGNRKYSERVTLVRAGDNDGVVRKVKNLVTGGDSERMTSLTLEFDREPQAVGQTVAESFTVDTSLLAPGDYGMVIEVSDGNIGRKRRVGCNFRLEEPRPVSSG